MDRIKCCSTDNFDERAHVRRRFLAHMRRTLLPGFLAGLGLAGLVGCLSGSNDPAPGEQSSAATATALTLGADDADYVPVPGGRLVHKSCVHVLAANDVLDQAAGIIQSADGSVKPVGPPCGFPTRMLNSAEQVSVGAPPPTDNGWTEDVRWDSPRDMRQFGASIDVPVVPNVSSDQIIFLFNALTTNDGANIIQPVLQWGVSQAGGGAFWAIAAWFGGDDWGGLYYASPLYILSRNDNPIRGGIWWTNDCNPAGCVWHIAACGMHCTEIAVRSSRTWPRVYGGVVEAYRVDDCNKYPASVETFFDFFLQDEALTNPRPAWRPEINVTTCRESIDILSSNRVNLHYNL